MFEKVVPFMGQKEENILDEIKTTVEDDIFTADSVAHGSSSVGAAMNRVKSCLNYSLKQKYGIENDEITETILRVHGLSKKNLEFINNFESLVESKAEIHSEESEEANIDQNSNKSDVSVSGVLNENATPIAKLLGYRYLYRKMVELYGKQRAKFLCGEMYDYSLALADSSNILKPYCFSINASRLVLEGRPFGKLHSVPPHRISSYIACLNETVHQLSNHTAGALAIATLFLDCARIMLFEEHKSLFKLKHSRKYRKYVRNCLQNFVHSMNHLSRNSTESPFTNVSTFDKAKLKGLLDEDNFGWYFDMEKKPRDFKFYKFFKGFDWTDYCVEAISEIQDIFMDIMDAGDVARNGLPITFPVTTLNISVDDNRDVVEPKFVKKICKHDIFRYNIFVSQGNKIASCCRLINDEDLFEQGAHVNSLGGGGSVSLGSHRVCTINLYRIFLETNSWEEYQTKLLERLNSCADILQAHKELIKDLTKRGLEPFIENGYLDLNRMFSTVGIAGFYEADKHLKEKYGDMDYLKVILETIEDFNHKTTLSGRGLIMNTEEIPAESMMTRLAKVDNILFGIPEKIYSNQFVPLFEEGHDVFERMDLDGRYGKLLSGGGIVHISLGEKITPTQSEKLIIYAAKAGCNHFALNPCYSICEDGHVSFGKLDTCPICGKPIKDYLTRTIGYFSMVSNWTNSKRENDFEKRDLTVTECLKVS